MKELAKELRHELLKFDHLLATRIRRKWRDSKSDKDAATHKRFCYAAADHYGVDPKTIQFIVQTKNWQDLKPAEHVKKLPSGLIKKSEAEFSIRDIVKDGGIHIDSKLWSRLNATLTKGQIKDLVFKAIRDNDLEPPYQPISKVQARSAFKALQEIDSKKLLRQMKTCTRWDYKYAISDWVIAAPNTGNEASNFFHQKARWQCGSKQFPSPFDIWYNDVQLMSLFNCFWTLKFKRITATEMRTAIALRKYIASQFKPAAAKCFYELFNSRSVYDPSSGWGDRVCGFMAANTTQRYCSTDPNSSLYDGYKAEVKAYKSTGQTVDMYCHGSELKGGMRKKYGHKGDTVFTSPPYFNAEQYSKDEGQSFKQFGNVSAWLQGFLYPTVKNAWDFLESDGPRGGILAMNIADIYDNSTGERGVLCDPMNDYISKLPGARYIGCIGLLLAKRPASGALEGKEGASIEPIWLWAKGGTWTLEDYIKNGFTTEVRGKKSLLRRK
jgi:hypothetical protein